MTSILPMTDAERAQLALVISPARNAAPRYKIAKTAWPDMTWQDFELIEERLKSVVYLLEFSKRLAQLGVGGQKRQRKAKERGDNHIMQPGKFQAGKKMAVRTALVFNRKISKIRENDMRRYKVDRIRL